VPQNLNLKLKIEKEATKLKTVHKNKLIPVSEKNANSDMVVAIVA